MPELAQTGLRETVLLSFLCATSKTASDEQGDRKCFGAVQKAVQERMKFFQCHYVSCLEGEVRAIRTAIMTKEN